MEGDNRDQRPCLTPTACAAAPEPASVSIRMSAAVNGEPKSRTLVEMKQYIESTCSPSTTVRLLRSRRRVTASRSVRARVFVRACGRVCEGVRVSERV